MSNFPFAASCIDIRKRHRLRPYMFAVQCVAACEAQVIMGPAQGLVEGKAAEGTPIICDVRDVAAAHVAAAERPSASGRYIVSQRAPIAPSFVSQTLRVCRPRALLLRCRPSRGCATYGRHTVLRCMLITSSHVLQTARPTLYSILPVRVSNLYCKSGHPSPARSVNCCQ